MKLLESKRARVGILKVAGFLFYWMIATLLIMPPTGVTGRAILFGFPAAVCGVVFVWGFGVTAEWLMRWVDAGKIDR